MQKKIASMLLAFPLFLNLPYTGSNIIQQINQQRGQANLSSLAFNQDLTDAAQAKAEDMWTRDYFAHSLPGENIWKFVDQTPYKGQDLGEDLAIAYPSAEDTVTAWMNSPEHKLVMLENYYNDIGAAVDCREIKLKQVCIVVAEFGDTPATMTISSFDDLFFSNNQ